MNNRAYYLDSYTKRFEANVIERLVVDNRPAVILDQTYFYPTSGGQPFDSGILNGIEVIDVQERIEDGEVIHILDQEVIQDSITAVIDWQRRFDHMQHHTGQHILSQAFIQVADAQTIGFHLSSSSVTIDLDKKQLPPERIKEAESLANEIIWQDRKVTVRNVSMEEAQTLPLRKIPATKNEQLRLIDIEDFDLTACGGTHVMNTGEVGIVKIVKQEKRGDKLRIEFRCGYRALNDYRQKHAIVTRLSTQLTTGGAELEAAVKRLQDDNKQSRHLLKKQRAELGRLEAKQLLGQAKPCGSSMLVTKVFSDREPGEVRALGSQLIREGGVIALLGLVGDRSHFIFCRSDNRPGDMSNLLYTALSEIGVQSGGGNEVFAQGVGPSANAALVQRAVDAAKNQLIEEIGGLG